MKCTLRFSKFLEEISCLSHSIVFRTSGNLHLVGVVFAQVEELHIPNLCSLISLQMPRLSFINHTAKPETLELKGLCVF